VKRRLLILAVFLLAGAVVNVAVAWGIAGTSTNYKTMRLQAIECREGERLVRAFTSFGSELVVGRIGPRLDATHGELGRWRRSRYERANPSRNDWSLLRKSEALPNIRMEEACGWPGLALRWYVRRTEPGLRGGIELGGTRRYSFTGHSGRGTVSLGLGDRTLPLLPIWPGFAVNTLLYATLLWLLICGPFTLRRFIRVKRGLCPACAYPGGESDVCSECGTTLHQRAKVTAT